nr:reverse transcriptase domain-containing protein [Tanacetum cinerariifolium]
MDDLNITMEEYIRLEEEKARRRAIVLNDALTSEVTLSCEPTVSLLNDNKIDFRISFDESDDEDYTKLLLNRSYLRIVVIMEYLVKISKKACIMELKRRYFAEYCSDNQYAVSSRRYGVSVPELTKRPRRKQEQYAVSKRPIRRIEDILIKYSRRYQAERSIIGHGKVKFLIVAIDYFTKWIEAKPVETITGAQIKKFVWDNIVYRFGLLEEIISDNGKQFRDNPFKYWCEKLCIHQCFASVKHPQANGLVEKANRSLGEGIKARNEEMPFSLTYKTETVIPVEIGMPTLRTAEVDMIKKR